MSGELVEDWNEPEGGTTWSGRDIVPGENLSEVALTRARIEIQTLPTAVTIRAIGGSLPSWVKPVVSSLKRLLTLKAGWDSYGAQAIRSECVSGTLQLLALVMRSDTPPPTIVPTNQGAIQIEWHWREADLEIEVLSETRSHVFFATSQSSWEEDLASDLTRLHEAVKFISG